jgi:hypothetical protein
MLYAWVQLRALHPGVAFRHSLFHAMPPQKPRWIFVSGIFRVSVAFRRDYLCDSQAVVTVEHYYLSPRDQSAI